MGSVMEQHGRTGSQGYSEASESSLRCCLVRWGRSSFVLFFLSPEVSSTPLKQNHQPAPTPPKLATCEHGTKFVCAPPTLLLILQRFPCNRGPNSRCLRSCREPHSGHSPAWLSHLTHLLWHLREEIICSRIRPLPQDTPIWGLAVYSVTSGGKWQKVLHGHLRSLTPPWHPVWEKPEEENSRGHLGLPTTRLRVAELRYPGLAVR